MYIILFTSRKAKIESVSQARESDGMQLINNLAHLRCLGLEGAQVTGPY